MFGLGLGEMMVIGAIALLVVGPEKLPHLMRELGRYYGQLRRAADDLRRAFVLEADRQDAADRYRALQERRKAAQEARKRAQESADGEGEARAQPEPTASAEPAAPTGALMAETARSAASGDAGAKDASGPVPNDIPPDAPHPALSSREVPNRPEMDHDSAHSAERTGETR